MEPGTIGAAVACALLTVFAIVLVVLDPRGVATRAFAALLVTRGVAGLTNALTEEADAFLAANAMLYLTAASLAFAGLIVRFGALYPRPRGFLATRAGLACVLAPALIAALAAALVPAWFVAWEGASPVRMPGVVASVIFPYLVIPFVALQMLRRAAAETTPELRRSLGLVALALLLDSVFALILTLTGIILAGSFPLAALPLARAAFWIAFVANGALLLAFLWYAFRRASSIRPLARAALALAIVAGLLAWVVASGLLGPIGSIAVRNFGRLPLALVIAYALVRHRVFGIDLTIKMTIRQSTIAAVFVGVFFIVSEIAQQLFQASAGPYVGIAAAGALVFAMAPLQRVAERVSERAMPHVHDPRTGTHADKLDLYRQAYVLALADGILTDDEERHLAKLAGMLSLTHEMVFEIRRSVTTPA